MGGVRHGDWSAHGYYAVLPSYLLILAAIQRSNATGDWELRFPPDAQTWFARQAGRIALNVLRKLCKAISSIAQIDARKRTVEEWRLEGIECCDEIISLIRALFQDRRKVHAD